MANVKASDNPFPSILIKEETEPAAPAAGHQRVYIDSTTHVPMIVNSSGTETPLGASVADILDLPTAETDDTLVLAPDGAGGVEFRAEAGGSSGPGSRMAVASITSPVSITATAEASANSIVSAGAVSFDGSTEVRIRFWAPWWNPDVTTAGNFIALYLFDGSTSLGRMGLRFNQAAAINNHTGPVYAESILTPSNASHTYSYRAIVNTGTGTVQAGAGGSGADNPAFIEIVRT